MTNSVLWAIMAFYLSAILNFTKIVDTPCTDFLCQEAATTVAAAEATAAAAAITVSQQKDIFARKSFLSVFPC